MFYYIIDSTFSFTFCCHTSLILALISISRSYWQSVASMSHCMAASSHTRLQFPQCLPPTGVLYVFYTFSCFFFFLFFFFFFLLFLTHFLERNTPFVFVTCLLFAMTHRFQARISHPKTACTNFKSCAIRGASEAMVSFCFRCVFLVSALTLHFFSKASLHHLKVAIGMYHYHL